MLPKGYDPYRTQYGGSLARISVAITVGLLVLGIFVFFFVERQNPSGGEIVWMVPMIAILTVVIVVAAIVAKRMV
ncbi:MAG: hypothetical protein AB1649_14920 [Chloroflexota bacterium]